MDEQVVIFSINGQQYALPVMQIKEIIRMVQVTPIPSSEHDVEGIINLRGKILTVINLSKKMGLPPNQYDTDTRIIVVEVNDKSWGLIVDEVVEVGRYAADEVESVEAVRGNVDFLSGAVKRDNKLWLILNLSSLLK